MKSNSRRRMALPHILLGAVFLIVLLVVRATNAQNQPVPLATDWSHRHVMFSAPHDLLDQFRLSRNPRYVQQRMRRDAERRRDDREWWRWYRSPESLDPLQGDWSMNLGSGATVGAGNYPAKFSFDQANASCADFVAYNTGVTGSATQATVVAFNNIYVGTGAPCGTTPSTYWSYNTGGIVATSVALSGDGSQLAFVQNNSAPTQVILVLLKWAANSGTLTMPVTPTAVTNSAYPSCVAPCMTTIVFSSANSGMATSDTLSSPFYDYNSDTLYAGDSFGFLHKFTHVFHGTAITPPSETISTTGANIWPSLASNNSPLTDPVFDNVTNQIFVGSLFGTLKRINATIGSGPGGITKTNQVGTTGENFDGPLLDATNGKIYLFVSKSDLVGSGQVAGVSAIYTFTTTFTAGDNGIQTILTNTGPGTSLYSGAFDNPWFLGSPGHLYVCASGAAGNIPTLYQIAVSTTGVLGTVSRGPALATAATGPPLCSPVTEFFNKNNTSNGAHPGGTDLIYLSVTALGVTTPGIGCPTNAGCLMSFDVTSGSAITSSTATAATIGSANGSSGIIVDGSSIAPGASQVYFTPLGNQFCTTSGATGGCAIQASQAGLN